MLANPVTIPAHTDPWLWGVALVAMWAEVGTVLLLLRRVLRTDVRGFLAPWFGVNFTTWFAFLLAVDRADRWRLDLGLAIPVLEVAVVLVEMVLLHSATRGRLFTSHVRCPPITWRQALLVVLLGNLVSIAVSLGVPAAVLSLTR